MNDQDVIFVASKIQNILSAASTDPDMDVPPEPCAQKDPQGRSYAHLLWMLNGIQLQYITGNKAHRWLGYIQGMLVAHGIVSLDDMKKLNQMSTRRAN